MISLPKKEYVLSIDTTNRYQVVVESTTEESAIEIGEQLVSQGEGELLDIEITDSDIEEINDV